DYYCIIWHNNGWVF
nr:immunoglobulin light chain junction region [Macaca mulatta]